MHYFSKVKIPIIFIHRQSGIFVFLIINLYILNHQEKMVPLMSRLVINYACCETKHHHTYHKELKQQHYNALKQKFFFPSRKKGMYILHV